MNLNDTIAIYFHDIKWDIDEDDKDVKIPSTNFIQIFTGYDLTNHFGKRDPVTGEFFLTNDELDEFLNNWLSDEFGFCHKGFRWDSCSEPEIKYSNYSDITIRRSAEFLTHFLPPEADSFNKDFKWQLLLKNESGYAYNVTQKQVNKLIGLLGNLQNSIQNDIEHSKLKPSMEVIVAKDQAQDFLKQIVGDNFFHVDYTKIINEND